MVAAIANNMKRKIIREKEYKDSIDGKFKKIRSDNKERKRCPKDGRMLDKNGICWMCGWSEGEDEDND